MSLRTIVATPPSRAEWLGARASLAVRRSGRLAVFAVAAFGVVLIALLLLPTLTGRTPSPAPPITQRVDTLVLRQRADSTQLVLTGVNASLDVALLRAESMVSELSRLTEFERQRRDSLHALASALDDLLDRATKAPLAPSYRALAGAQALNGDVRIASLVDSIDAIERDRTALDPTSAERVFADLTNRANAIGLSVREIATKRRAQLARNMSAIQSSSAPDSDVEVSRLRLARDSARLYAATADSTITAARVTNNAADAREKTIRSTMSHRVPLLAILVAATVMGLLVGFSITFTAELGHATVASAREAEWATGAPVVATVRAGPRRVAGAQETGGIDPFRMLFLALTATGTRTRTVAVSGDDRGVVATVAGRLALAAAADERATLVVDVDAESSAAAAYYAQPPEPGFSDALAGVRLWREVAHPVGASSRLAIDVVPAGSVHRETLDGDARALGRDEFARFRGEYDFSVLVAPSGAELVAVRGLMDDMPTVLCAQIARTAMSELHALAQRLRDGGVAVHGVVLWDGDSPTLASRGELMAGAAGNVKVQR